MAGTVLLVLSDAANPFFSAVARSVQHAVVAAGCNLEVLDSALSVHVEEAHLRAAGAGRVVGVLLNPVDDPRRVLNELRNRRVPFVVLDRHIQNTNVCSVSVDHVTGGRMAVEHLQQLGHRRIGVVGRPTRLPQLADRRLGASLCARRIAGTRLTTLHTEHPDIDGGRTAADALASMAAADRPTAVFALTDQLATGLVQGLLQADLSVPEHISVIGYDDCSDRSADLTTIHQPTDDLAIVSLDLLAKECGGLRHPHQHHSLLLQPHLRVGSSTSRQR